MASGPTWPLKTREGATEPPKPGEDCQSPGYVGAGSAELGQTGLKISVMTS